MKVLATNFHEFFVTLLNKLLFTAKPAKKMQNHLRCLIFDSDFIEN